jgi:hypothetical protein
MPSAFEVFKGNLGDITRAYSPRMAYTKCITRRPTKWRAWH